MGIYARLTHNQKPTYHPIVIYQGSTFSDTITLKNTDGTAYDLIDYSVRGQIRREPDMNSAVSFTCSIEDVDDGIIKISLSALATSNLECINYAPTTYHYDIEIVDDGTSGTNNKIVYRILQGIITVMPNVTRF